MQLDRPLELDQGIDLNSVMQLHNMLTGEFAGILSEDQTLHALNATLDSPRV